MYKSYFLLIISLILFNSCDLMRNNIIYQSNEFSVFGDSIVQGRFVAKAISRNEIVSNYVSPADEFKSPEVKFKFSINGADNSAPTGKDNVIICAGGDGNYESPVIPFGKQFLDSTKISSNAYLKKDVKL